MKMPEILWRIEAPYFVCGFIVRGGKIIKAAPIIKWLKGKTLFEARSWCNYRRFKVAKIE
jgi:hypothetical protein